MPASSEAKEDWTESTYRRVKRMFRIMDHDGDGAIVIASMRRINEEMAEILCAMVDGKRIQESEWISGVEEMLKLCPEISAEDLVSDLESLLTLSADARKGEISSAAKRVRSMVESSPIIRQLDADNLRLGLKIGHGHFADVFLGTFCGTDVAIKRIRRSYDLDDRSLDVLFREINLLSYSRHPSILCLLGISMSPLAIVTEFCSMGTVFDFFQKSTSDTLSWKQRVRLALDEAKGVAFLHQANIVHRDLKSLNLFLNEHMRLKIGDFGLARRLLPSNGGSLTKECGTYQWMAPEVLTGTDYDTSADIFSFAINLWEFATMKIPWKGINPRLAARQVQRDNARLPISASIQNSAPVEYLNLMRECWSFDPKKRPTMELAVSVLRKIYLLIQNT